MRRGCWRGRNADGEADPGEQEIATERLRELLREVSAKAGVGLGEVTATCVGIAGYAIAEVRDWAERVVGEMVAGEVQVCGDDEIALEAAFAGGRESW